MPYYRSMCRGSRSSLSPRAQVAQEVSGDGIFPPGGLPEKVELESSFSEWGFNWPDQFKSPDTSSENFSLENWNSAQDEDEDQWNALAREIHEQQLRQQQQALEDETEQFLAALEKELERLGTETVASHPPNPHPQPPVNRVLQVNRAVKLWPLHTELTSDDMAPATAWRDIAVLASPAEAFRQAKDIEIFRERIELRDEAIAEFCNVSTEEERDELSLWISDYEYEFHIDQQGLLDIETRALRRGWYDLATLVRAAWRWGKHGQEEVVSDVQHWLNEHDDSEPQQESRDFLERLHVHSEDNCGNELDLVSPKTLNPRREPDIRVGSNQEIAFSFQVGVPSVMQGSGPVTYDLKCRVSIEPHSNSADFVFGTGQCWEFSFPSINIYPSA